MIQVEVGAVRQYIEVYDVKQQQIDRPNLSEKNWVWISSTFYSKQTNKS